MCGKHLSNTVFITMFMSILLSRANVVVLKYIWHQLNRPHASNEGGDRYDLGNHSIAKKAYEKVFNNKLNGGVLSLATGVKHLAILFSYTYPLSIIGM